QGQLAGAAEVGPAEMLSRVPTIDGFAGPGTVRPRAGGQDGRASLSTGAELGELAPLAGSTVSATASPGAIPKTTTGAVIPRCGAGSMPAARTRRGPISHTW